MPLYPAAVKQLIPPGVNDPRIVPRVAILHVDAGNAENLHDFFATRSGGVESHFHVTKTGKVYQYRDTDWQADANLDANDFAVSIETQGFGAGEWTHEQLESIKSLLLWLSTTHDIPLRKCDAWNGSGVGYHVMFGAPGHWTPKAKTCPGADRIRQFDEALVPWMDAVHGVRLTVLTANLGRGVTEGELVANVRALGHRWAVKGFQEIDEDDDPEEHAVLAREMQPGWAAFDTRVPISVPPPWRIVRVRITKACDGLAHVTPLRVITQALIEQLGVPGPPRLVIVNTHFPRRTLRTVTRRRACRRALREVIAYWHDRGYTAIWMGDTNTVQMRPMHELEQPIVDAGLDHIRVIPHPNGVQVEVLTTRDIDLTIDGHDAHLARLRLTPPLRKES